MREQTNTDRERKRTATREEVQEVAAGLDEMLTEMAASSSPSARIHQG